MDIGAIFAWALFGLVVGLLARLLMPGRQSMGIFMTMALGVIGSLMGGFLFWALKLGGSPYHPAGFIMSTIGAIIVLAIAYPATNRRVTM